MPEEMAEQLRPYSVVKLLRMGPGCTIVPGRPNALIVVETPAIEKVEFRDKVYFIVREGSVVGELDAQSQS